MKKRSSFWQRLVDWTQLKPEPVPQQRRRPVEAAPEEFKHQTAVKVLEGHDAWAPMALVNGRLILRDLTQMVCLKVK